MASYCPLMILAPLISYLDFDSNYYYANLWLLLWWYDLASLKASNWFCSYCRAGLCFLKFDEVCAKLWKLLMSSFLWLLLFWLPEKLGLWAFYNPFFFIIAGVSFVWLFYLMLYRTFLTLFSKLLVTTGYRSELCFDATEDGC